MIWMVALAAVLAASWRSLYRRARFAWVPSRGSPPQAMQGGAVRTVHFGAIDGTRLEGWLFLPEGSDSPPVVVMAAGLGGTKDSLESFAWTFVQSGMAVLAFDYRCFGGSDGLPRHWVALRRHREDYEAAIAFVQRELTGCIDSARLALWGSSFSGGTALASAAKRNDVRAVIAQCPYLQTPPHIEPRGIAMARFIFWATLDMLRVLPPIYVPLFGRPGEWVFAPSRENPSVNDFEGPLGSDFWRRLPKPPLGGWENRMLARGLASMDECIPMHELDHVSCPVLLVAADRDDMVPRAYVEEACAKLGHPGELVAYDCGHFDLYFGPVHRQNVRRQAAFLARELGVPTQRSEAQPHPARACRSRHLGG